MNIQNIDFSSLFFITTTRHPEILKDRDLSGELKDVWNAVQALRDKQRAENHFATQENLVLYTEFGPESAPPMYQLQQRETVIQYSGQSAIINNKNNIGNSTNEAVSLKDHMEKISSETENMKISPTEHSDDQAIEESKTLNDSKTTLPNKSHSICSPTSVIVSTGNATINGQPSPKNEKKESSVYNQSSSSSFLTKFRSSKTSNYHQHQQDHHQDTIIVQDTKKDSDPVEHHQQSKHKKFLSYIRRKAGTKNENCSSRESKKSNMDSNPNTSMTTNSQNGNNEENIITTDYSKSDIVNTPIIHTK